MADQIPAGVHLIHLSGSQRACADGESGGVTGAGLCAGAAAARGGAAESLCRISCSSACTLAISPCKLGTHRSTSLFSPPGCVLPVLAPKLRIKGLQGRQERGRLQLLDLHCRDPLINPKTSGANVQGSIDSIAAILKKNHQYAEFGQDRDI